MDGKVTPLLVGQRAAGRKDLAIVTLCFLDGYEGYRVTGDAKADAGDSADRYVRTNVVDDKR